MSVYGGLIPTGYQTFTNPTTGGPVASGNLYSYQAGTTTPQSTYTDATLNTPNENPLVLDSFGGATAWFPIGTGYKFVLEDANGNVLWTRDQVYGVPPGAIGSQQIADGAVGTTQMAEGSVTGGSSGIIAIGTITGENIVNGAIGTDQIATGGVEFGNLDPEINLTPLDRMIEVTAIGANGQAQLTPQYTWAPSPTALSAPDTPPTGISGGVAWSPDGQFLAVSHDTTPYISVYQRYGNNLYKLADPSFLPGSGAVCISWSPEGKFLALGLSSAPYIQLYEVQGTNLLELPCPGSAPASVVNGISWSRNSQFLACALGSSPYIAVYERDWASGVGIIFALSSAESVTVGAIYDDPNSDPWAVISTTVGSTSLYCTGDHQPPTSGTLTLASGTGPSTIAYAGVTSFNKYGPQRFKLLSNPGTIPTGPSESVAWSLDGQFLAITSIVSSPYFIVYQNIAGVLTAIASPSTMPATGCFGVAWSPDGQILAVGCTSPSPYIMFYQMSAGALTYISSLTEFPPDSALGISWSANSAYIAISVGASPYNYFYVRSGTSFIKIKGPTSLPAGATTAVAFSPDARFVAFASSSSPYLFWYETAALTHESDSLFWIGSLNSV